MNLSLRNVTVPTVDVEFLASAKGIITKGVTIDADTVRTGQYVANCKQLKAGTPLGKITATGLYGPVKKTTLKAAVVKDATEITLNDARFFQVGDEIIVGTEAAAIAITAVDYATGVVTLESGIATEAGQAKDVTVKVANGLETAELLLGVSVDLTDGDAAVAGYTQCVANSARVPGYNALIKADLTRIEFR